MLTHSFAGLSQEPLVLLIVTRCLKALSAHYLELSFPKTNLLPPLPELIPTLQAHVHFWLETKESFKGWLPVGGKMLNIQPPGLSLMSQKIIPKERASYRLVFHSKLQVWASCSLPLVSDFCLHKTLFKMPYPSLPLAMKENSTFP